MCERDASISALNGSHGGSVSNMVLGFRVQATCTSQVPDAAVRSLRRSKDDTASWCGHCWGRGGWKYSRRLEVFLSDGTAHHQHHDNLPTSGPQS